MVEVGAGSFRPISSGARSETPAVCEISRAYTRELVRETAGSNSPKTRQFAVSKHPVTLVTHGSIIDVPRARVIRLNP